MSLVVPFDGSALSKAALVRAVQFGAVLSEPVLVVSVIPKDNTEYARSRGWIDRTKQFALEEIVSNLRATVADIAPDAGFHYILVDRHAPRGTIANRIRKFAREHDASIVFIGSENAGRIVNALTVGVSIAADRSYDTMIVANENPPEIQTLEEELSADEALS